MDSPAYPFTNLDVTCTWTGDPRQDVDVLVTVDIWCTPEARLTVLDTRNPATSRVKEFALVPKTEKKVHILEPDAESNTDPQPLSDPEPEPEPEPDPPLDPKPADASPDPSVILTLSPPPSVTDPSYAQYQPVTPGREDCSLVTRGPTSSLAATPGRESSNPSILSSPGSLPDPESLANDSDSESIIIQKNLHQDAFLGGNILPDPFFLDLPVLKSSPLQDEQSPAGQQDGGPEGRNILVPRKRSAKAASLPDSVTDSERGYGKKSSLTSPGKESRPRGPRSMIPRPRLKSLSSHEPSPCDPSKIPLPRDSVPVLEADFRRFEKDISPLFKENSKDSSVEWMSKRSPGSYLEVPSPVTPSKTGRKARGEDGRSSIDLEKVSTVAVVGSPCDFTGLPGESDKSSSTNSSGQHGGVFLVQQPCIRTNENRTADDEKGPRLVFLAGKFYISAPSNIKPATYQARITLSVTVQEGRPGWHELTLLGLPRLAPDENAYVYFMIPIAQGVEFRTNHLKRHKLVEGCLMAQMLIPSRLVIPFRPCNVNFFGYLKNFNIPQSIRAEILETVDDKKGNKEGSFHLVRYHAICSISQIQADFWAERCGLWVYISGGPKGQFFCPIQDGSHVISLESPDNEVGGSAVEILCSRSMLEKFIISWDMKVSTKSPIWMPRIRASEEYGTEEELRDDFMEMETRGMLQTSQSEESQEKPELQEPEIQPALPPDTPAPEVVCHHWRIFFRTSLWLLIGMAIFRVYWGVLDSLCLEERIPEILCLKGYERSDIPQPEDELPLQMPVVPSYPEEMGSNSEAVQVQVQINYWEGDTVGEKDEEKETSNASDNRRVPLRDRVDYLLGWRGPVRDA